MILTIWGNRRIKSVGGISPNQVRIGLAVLETGFHQRAPGRLSSFEIWTVGIIDQIPVYFSNSDPGFFCPAPAVQIFGPGQSAFRDDP